MIIKEIVEAVKGRIAYGLENEEVVVEAAFASDLMSDVLTVVKDNLLLISGLCGVQTIRTAIMSDIVCVLLVRDKKASEEMIAVARENNVTIIECPYSMFKVSGILFAKGLSPVY